MEKRKEPAEVSGPRKKRDPNPGVRHQGGRIYDSENGTTCHQCRQKTLEIKAKCTACTLFFCPRCLENRYNEMVTQVNTLPDWTCPRCRKLCNCSNCRKKMGLGATGILAKVARTAGFSCVSDLLNKNPHAKAIYQKDSGADNFPAEITDAKIENAAKRAEAHKKVTRKLSNSTKTETFGPEKMSEERHPQRRMLLDIATARLPIRVPGQPSNEDSSVPQDVCIGELISIVECLLTFASTLMPWTDGEYQASVVSTAKVISELCASEDSTLSDASQLQLLHARLMELLIEAWSEGSEPDSAVVGSPPCSSPQKEFPAFVSYYAETQLPLAKVTALRREFGPPAVAQGSYIEAAMGIVLPSSYQEISPGTRVSMLYALLHDVLDTGSLRREIDAALDIEIEEERKESARRAEARRLAREEYKRKRDQMIASLIAGSNLTALSLEEQRLVVDKARQRVAEDLADRLDMDASHVRGTSTASTSHQSKVRVVPHAGEFQITGGVSYRMACSEMLTGCDDALVICSQGGLNGDEPVDFAGPGVVHLYRADKVMCT